MNPNLAEVGRPTRWPPGKSGNPAGKPPGTRTAFSQGFIRDFALVWAEEGLEAVRKVAKKSPEAFVAIAARICPNDVRLTLEQAIPGGMSLEDYLLMREVIAAIREGLPDADQMQPGQVFQHVLGALRDCSKNDQKRTVLFAPTEFANDTKLSILQLNGEITRIPILHLGVPRPTKKSLLHGPTQMDAGDRGSGLIIAKPLEEKDPGSPLRRADAPSPPKRNHAIVMDGRLADCRDARVVLAWCV